MTSEVQQPAVLAPTFASDAGFNAFAQALDAAVATETRGAVQRILGKGDLGNDQRREDDMAEVHYTLSAWVLEGVPETAPKVDPNESQYRSMMGGEFAKNTTPLSPHMYQMQTDGMLRLNRMAKPKDRWGPKDDENILPAFVNAFGFELPSIGHGGQPFLSVVQRARLENALRVYFAMMRVTMRVGNSSEEAYTEPNPTDEIVPPEIPGLVDWRTLLYPASLFED